MSLSVTYFVTLAVVFVLILCKKPSGVIRVWGRELVSWNTAAKQSRRGGSPLNANHHRAVPNQDGRATEDDHARTA